MVSLHFPISVQFPIQTGYWISLNVSLFKSCQISGRSKLKSSRTKLFGVLTSNFTTFTVFKSDAYSFWKNVFQFISIPCASYSAGVFSLLDALLCLDEPVLIILMLSEKWWNLRFCIFWGCSVAILPQMNSVVFFHIS